MSKVKLTKREKILATGAWNGGWAAAFETMAATQLNPAIANKLRGLSTKPPKVVFDDAELPEDYEVTYMQELPLEGGDLDGDSK